MPEYLSQEEEAALFSRIQRDVKTVIQSTKAQLLLNFKRTGSNWKRLGTQAMKDADDDGHHSSTIANTVDRDGPVVEDIETTLTRLVKEYIENASALRTCYQMRHHLQGILNTWNGNRCAGYKTDSKKPAWWPESVSTWSLGLRKVTGK